MSEFAHSKDERYLAGITGAARGLAGIAIQRLRINEAIWLLARYFKWSSILIYRRYVKTGPLVGIQ